MQIITCNMKFTPPTPEQVCLHAAKIGLSDIEAHKFIFYYESVGWVVGRKQMVSWQHAMQGWKLRCAERVERRNQISPSAQAILWQTELKRVEARIDELRLRNKTDTHVTIPWPKEDKEEIKKHKTRRAELVKLLGLSI